MSVTTLRPQEIRETATGLLFPVAVTYEQWVAVFFGLQRDHKSFMWRLGDAALEGDRRFGEIHAQAVENYSIETIDVARRVCLAFPPHRRRSCGFYFHQVTYALPAEAQDELLDVLEGQDWTRETFRQHVREWKKATEAAKQPRMPIEPETAAEPAPDLEPVENADPGDESDVRIVHDAMIVPPETPFPGDDAAATLEQLGRAALPGGIMRAIEAVLEERRMLKEIARAAEASYRAGHFLPSLAVALEKLAR